MERWREEHPTADWQAIDEALDSRLTLVQAEMLSDLATSSAATEGVTEAKERVTCPRCGGRTERHGYRTRSLTGPRDAATTLNRCYLTCTVCKHGFFPSGQ